MAIQRWLLVPIAVVRQHILVLVEAVPLVRWVHTVVVEVATQLGTNRVL